MSILLIIDHNLYKEITPFADRKFVIQAARHIVNVNAMTDSLINPSGIFKQKSNSIQLTGCTVYLNGRSKGEKEGVAKYGTGGKTHAEQLAWADSNLLDKIKSGDIIEFDVDRPICGDCVIWFEKTLYPIINDKGGILNVSVNYQKATYDVNVTGVGTNWGKACEEGSTRRVKLKFYYQRKMIHSHPHNPPHSQLGINTLPIFSFAPPNRKTWNMCRKTYYQ